MKSVWSVSKLSTESVGSRRELVANCVHTADATKQFRGVGGVYWAIHTYFISNTAVQNNTHDSQGRSDGGYIGIYTPEISPSRPKLFKKLIPLKQISGYAPDDSDTMQRRSQKFVLGV